MTFTSKQNGNFRFLTLLNAPSHFAAFDLLQYCLSAQLSRLFKLFFFLSQKQNGAGGREEREERAEGGRSVKCRRVKRLPVGASCSGSRSEDQDAGYQVRGRGRRVWQHFILPSASPAFLSFFNPALKNKQRRHCC